MTVSSANNRNQYTGNGSNTEFTYTFKIFDQDDITVYIDDTLKTITTHYTVAGVADPSGGEITFLVAPTNGAIVTLLLDEPFTQEIDYVDGDDFPASAHEEGLDRSVLRDLKLKEEVDRSIKLEITSSESDVTIADLTDQAGKVVVVNDDEDGFEYGEIVSDLEGIVISGGDAGKPVVVNGTEDGFEVGEALLPDGDYGDVTVSSSGAAITIDNDAVTYTKMQNVSATDKLLGRSTSGAGNVEEITCTAAGRALLDDADAAAQRATLGLTVATTSQSTPSNPTLTASATQVMMGLAGTITPTKSGTVLMVVECDIEVSSGGADLGTRLRYGTGTAPSNGDALTGTVTGRASIVSPPSGSDPQAHVLSSIVTGLTPSTAYWIDISLGTSGGNAAIKNVLVRAIEL